MNHFLNYSTSTGSVTDNLRQSSDSEDNLNIESPDGNIIKIGEVMYNLYIVNNLLEI